MVNINNKIGSRLCVSGSTVMKFQNQVNIKIIQQVGWIGPLSNKAYTPPPGMPTRGSPAARRQGEAGGGGSGAATGSTGSSSTGSKATEVTPTGGADPDEKKSPPGEIKWIPVGQPPKEKKSPPGEIKWIPVGQPPKEKKSPLGEIKWIPVGQPPKEKKYPPADMQLVPAHQPLDEKKTPPGDMQLVPVHQPPDEKKTPPGDMQLVPAHQPQPPRQYPPAAIRAVLGGDVERICYVLNLLLSKSATLQAYLPFRDHDLFGKLENGVVLCVMANLLQPGTINEKTMAVLPPNQGSPMEVANNVNLGLMSLNMLGVSLGGQEATINADLLYHQSALHLTAILLQWIRLVTVGRMNLRHSPQLAYTLGSLRDTDEVTALHVLSPEDMLLRWINYQLWKAGNGLVMTSFDPRNDDTAIYAHVLYAVAPLEKRPSLILPQAIIDETDPTKRAVMVVKNATALGLGQITGPELILPIGTSNNEGDENACALIRSSILRPVLFSQVFANYPNIAKPAGSNKEDESTLFEKLKHSTKEGASEEALTMWLNSFGPSSPVKFLSEDLRSGITLLEVLEFMYPGCVNWSKVNVRSYPKMDPKALEKASFLERVTDARRKFHWLSNCALVMEIVKLQKLTVNCSASDITTGEMKNTLALVFVMMLRYAQDLRKKALGGEIKEPTDQELVQWFNEKLKAYGSSFLINNIRDPSLKNTNALGFVGERLLAVSQCCTLCESCQVAAQKWAAGLGPAPAALAGVAQELEKPKTQAASQPKPFRSNSNVENQTSSFTDEPDSEFNFKANSNVESPNSGTDDPESNNALRTWHFQSVQELSGYAMETCSYTTIALLRQGSVRVYTSKLGPNCDVSVYRNLLLQLNTIEIRKRQTRPLNKSEG